MMGLKISDLEGKAFDVALESAQYELEDQFYSNEIPEFLKSVRVFCDDFGLIVDDYDVNLFSKSSVRVSYGDSWDNEDVALDYVNQINELVKREENGDCSITGAYTDGLLFEGLYGQPELTLEDDVLARLNESLREGLYKFVVSLENDLGSNKYIVGFANDREMKFEEDGTLI